MIPAVRSFLFALGTALMTSCAAMFTGTKGEVRFLATPAEGTTVLVGDKTYSIDEVPVEIKKGTKNVVFSNPAYGEYVVPVNRDFNGGFLLMDILFTPGYGLVGILIDGGTSAWFKLPSTIEFDFAAEVARPSTDKDSSGTKLAKATPEEVAKAIPATAKAGP